MLTTGEYRNSLSYENKFVDSRGSERKLQETSWRMGGV